MLKFFRKIRHRLLVENNFSKYLLYALGEIVLVVIGILIALQINTWNNDSQDRNREEEYLRAIRTNLESDKNSAVWCINYNKQKIEVIDSVLQLLDKSQNVADYIAFILENQRLLMTFPTFDPISTTFDNMTASHSISLIQNDDLRLRLSGYYNYDWEKSPQSVSRSRTRKFADILTVKLIDKPSFHSNLESVFEPLLSDDIAFKWTEDFSMNFKDPAYLEFHNDRAAIASMFTMLPTAIYQNTYIEGAINNIDSMIQIIDDQVGDNE